jgi:DeoR/GlpR family transcriptional regulator of sugar metabolism
MADKSDDGQREPGKSREVHTSQDMLKAIKLLEYLHRGGRVEASELANFFADAGLRDNNTPEKISRIVDALTRSSLPVRLVEDYLYWADLFDEQAVGRRKRLHWASKEKMAKKVVEMLIAQSPMVRSVFLGAGTSVLAVTHELISRIKDFKSLHSVYTNNFLAMSELVRHKLPIPVHVPEGEIMLQDGAIIGDQGIDSLNQKRFEAVVTGFYGLSYHDGFSSDHTYDKKEKLMNLRPANCSKIYIVLNWEKIGTSYEVVATVEEGIDENKEYFIVTDRPKDWQTNPAYTPKLQEIAKWSVLVDRRIVQFVHVERPASP